MDESYIYLGNRLLSTLEPNGSGGEAVRYHHPDRLGTRLITTATETNPAGTTAQEQVSLPFGTALDNESTGASKRRFTSYDRSAMTGLDYAVNRHYDSQQGRFTQVDPIGMKAANVGDPQSLNLYSYVGNDPINRLDPSGLMWGWLKRLINRVVHAFVHAVVQAVFTFLMTGDLKAAIAVGVADFFKELGWPSKGYLVNPGGTPQWNPNVVSILSGGPSGLSRYIIYNFTNSQQGSGFLYGRFPFSLAELARLLKAFDKVNSDKCRKFFNDTIAAMRKNGEIHSQYAFTPSTLEGALAITTFNKYSSSLTAKQVGVSKRSWRNVRDTFEQSSFFKHTNGVTLGADGRVFLGDNAFFQADELSQFFRKDADLSGIVVHELFHRAGLNEDQVHGLAQGIQENCGTPGDAL